METTSFTYKTGPCSDVLIIGGGLAGMYSALAAAESGTAVRILCKSKTGGSGNSVVAMSVHRFAPDAPGLREDYRRRFLASGAGQQDAEIAAFFVDHAAAAMERLRGLGLPLEYRTLSENGGEYPYLACCSPKQGRILTKAMREKLNEYPNIAVEDGVTVCDILTENGRAQGVLALCGGEMRVYPAKTVILCCGGAGNVYAATSNTRDVTGDGYAMAAALGHTIVPPRGSLVPLESGDADCAAMQGLSLRNVEATVLNGKNKPVFREFGEMLFTHFGVSGPLMLSASAHLRRWDKEQYRLSIDLKPALDQQKLDSRILRDIGENPNRDMANILSGLVHRSMVPVLLRRLALPEGEKANSLTKEQRRALVQELKHFTVSLTGPRPVAEAIVTAGGVKVGDVVPGTMASKLAEGLYFAGEILDVDAYTGGFNLQIAWATGYLAGLSAAEQRG